MIYTIVVQADFGEGIIAASVGDFDSVRYRPEDFDFPDWTILSVWDEYVEEYHRKRKESVIAFGKASWAKTRFGIWPILGVPPVSHETDKFRITLKRIMSIAARGVDVEARFVKLWISSLADQFPLSCQKFIFSSNGWMVDGDHLLTRGEPEDGQFVYTRDVLQNMYPREWRP